MHINTQNNLDIQKICNTTFDCECGWLHNVATEQIVVGEDITIQFLESLQQIVPKGSKIFVISDNTIWGQLGVVLCKKLSRFGYRVDKQLFRDGFVITLPFFVQAPEDASLVLAIGSGSVADTAKYIAKTNGLPLYLYATSLFAKNLLAPSTFVQKNGYIELVKTPVPIGISVDLKNFSTYSRLDTCNAVAAFCANCITLFDWYLQSVVEHSDYCKNIANQLLDNASILVRQLYSYLAGEITTTILQHSLIEKIIRLGALCQCIGDSRLICGSHTIAAMAIKMAKVPYAFFDCEIGASKRLVDIYAECIIYTCTPQKAFIPPPDNHKRSDKISELLSVDPIYNFAKIAPYYNKKHIDSCIRKISLHKNILLSVLSAQKVMLESVFVCINKIAGLGLDYGFLTGKGILQFSRIPQNTLDTLIALAPDIHLKQTALSVFKQITALDKYL